MKIVLAIRQKMIIQLMLKGIIIQPILMEIAIKLILEEIIPRTVEIHQGEEISQEEGNDLD